MSTSTDYTGRQVDISIFPDMVAPGQLVDATFSENPKAIAGAMMVAQNFARILLTQYGHYKNDPTMGSFFFEKLTTRNMQFPSDLELSFLLEKERVLRYMNSLLTDEVPDDERIRSATLLSANVSGSNVDLTIQIETVAGITMSFLLPVQWSI